MWDNTRVFIHIYVLEFCHNNVVDLSCLYFLRATLLTESDVRARLSTEGWALMTTTQELVATLGTRDPVAWCCAWHAALGMGAA